MKRLAKPLPVIFIALFFFGSLDAAKAETVIKLTDEGISLANEYIEIVFARSSGPPPIMRIVNKLTGREIPIDSDEFSIGIEGKEPLRPANFRYRHTVEQKLPRGRRLMFIMQCDAPKVDLRLTYELGDDDFFVRRWLEIRPEKPLALRKLEAWKIGIEGKATYQGYGVPIFLDDTFWGLEFPGGINAYADGAVSLTHHPGRTISEPYTSKTAVLGVSEPGRVRRSFLEYVKTFQATPKDLKLFVNYNTWWTLMPPTEKNCLELIDQFREKLYLPYGESIDTFTLDDGWDDKNSLWKIRKDRFPDGFTPLVERLKTIDARLGLWLSPSSGYSHAPWGEANGYARNPSNQFYLCQSSPKYRRDIVPVVTEYAKKYDMAFFKFDGFCARCSATDHGHLPGLLYSKEANIEAFCELMSAVRRERPGCYIDPTCGMWLSPWWLRWADSIWGPVSGDLASAIVPAPVSRFSATTTRDSFYRLRCRDYQGFPPAAVEHLGVIVVTPEPWEDNAMAVLGRGCRLLTLYINPKCFHRGERDWAFLASILKWARHNGDTLHHDCQMILGEPMKREPYGYAHFNGQHGIISVRNPFIDRRDVEVKLDESAGWSRAAAGDARYVAKIVYPRQETLPEPVRFGDLLRLSSAPYETQIVELSPLSESRPTVLGARCRELKSEGNRLEYEIHGLPGREQSVSVYGPAPVRATLDGRPVELVAHGDHFEFTLPQAESTEPKVENEKIELQPSTKGFKLSGDCTVDVPDGAEASVHILCEFDAPKPRELECKASIDGRPAKVETVRKQWMQMSDETAPGKAWTWFKFTVPGGRSRVELTIDNYQADGKPLGGVVDWRLWTERPTATHKLILEMAEPVARPTLDPLPLPLEMNRFRQVTPIGRSNM